jgi:hypothetical protein
MKRIALALLAGAVVFGAVYAFAASLSVSSSGLGAGNASVSACNASATVTYNTSYSATVPGYKVTTAPVTSAVGCATKSYKVTLTGTGSTSLGEVTGALDATGAASPDFTASNIAASGVLGVSVVISG